MSLLLLFAVLTSQGAPAKPANNVPQASVGMPLELKQVVLPGPQLEARPWTDRRQQLVVRIREVYPHGDAFRYDLECVGYEPGDYDLREQLRRPDGVDGPELPAIPVRIVALLPPGQIEPHALTQQPTPRWGGYRPLLVTLAAVWVVGLVVMLTRYRRRTANGDLDPRAVPTLAERLQPLIDRAQRGQLSTGEQAEIERLLLAHWRQRLELDEAHPAAAVTALRAHPEAGALLRRLEAWLHDPEPSRELDLAELLAPYRGSAAPVPERAEQAGASR